MLAIVHITGVMMRYLNTLTVIFISIFSIEASAASIKFPESHYQTIWCNSQAGDIEVRLPDRTRVDCLTRTHAVEVDFAKKWYQAVGQSLYYSLQTGKKAGIVLIVREPKERKYRIRLNSTILHFKLPIDTWIYEEMNEREP